MPYIEKRHGRRYAFNKPIQYAFTSSNQLYNVHTINVSKNGLCFQTGYEVKPHRRIYIKTDVLEQNRSPAATAKGVLAEVRWCHKVAGKSAFFYCVGVKYKTIEQC